MRNTGILVATCLAMAHSIPAATLTETVTEAMDLFRVHHLSVEESAAQRAVVQAMARTADPGAEIVTADEAAHRSEEQAGRDYSAGFRLSITNGLPVVIAVASNSPAERAGLSCGDIILSTSPTNPLDVITLPEILRATRGHADTVLELEYRNARQPTNTARMKLELRDVPAIECAEKLPNGIFYVKLNGLYAGAGAAVADTLRNWTASNRSGVILDLRGAGGNDLESVRQVASLFARPGDLLFTMRDRADQDLQVSKAAEGRSVGVPVMAIVDHDTRGTAEALAGVLNNSVKGAMLVGRTTRGDPAIREYVKLRSGLLLYLATRQIITADGQRFDGRSGVKPDVIVTTGTAGSEYDAEPVADRRQLLEQELQDYALRGRIRGDHALRRAVDILLGLKALNIGAGASAESLN